MEITIDFLKQMATTIYDAVHPILGTPKAGKKLERGAGGDISMYIDIVAENIVIDLLKSASLDILLISEEVGEIFIGDKEKAIKNKQRLRPFCYQ